MVQLKGIHPQAIDQAAKKLTHDSYRHALFALIAVLDNIWSKESESK